MKNWGDNGLTPTQRLLRCFAELDTTKIKNTDRSQLISSIQADYGLTLEEATMLIAEKEADVTMGKWYTPLSPSIIAPPPNNPKKQLRGSAFPL